MSLKLFISFLLFSILGALSLKAQITPDYVSQRKPLEKRLFTSQVIEDEITLITNLLTNPKLRWMFENCFPNTLETTVHFRMTDGIPDTFVYTGDSYVAT